MYVPPQAVPPFSKRQYTLSDPPFSPLAAAAAQDVANSLLPAYMSIQAFFVGVMILEQKIPVYWQWFKYLSFIRFGWRAYMINHFVGLNDPILFTNTGTSVLTYYLMNGENYWWDIGYLSIFAVVFMIAMYLAISYVSYARR